MELKVETIHINKLFAPKGFIFSEDKMNLINKVIGVEYSPEIRLGGHLLVFETLKDKCSGIEPSFWNEHLKDALVPLELHDSKA